MCGTAYDTQCQRNGRVDTTVPASIEEMLDFTGVISATSVNYSCVLIVWLELTKTTSLNEQIHMPKQHIDNSFTDTLIITL